MNLPAFGCCLFADGSSACTSPPSVWLNTTGAREMVPEEEEADGGLRRLAYRDRPPREDCAIGLVVHVLRIFSKQIVVITLMSYTQYRVP